MPVSRHDRGADQPCRAPGHAALGARYPEPPQRGLLQRRAAEGAEDDRAPAQGGAVPKRRKRKLGPHAHSPHCQRCDGRPRLLVQAQRRMGLPHHAARRGPAGRRDLLERSPGRSRETQLPRSRYASGGRLRVGLLGILIGLGLLIWLAFRGWSVLLLAPSAALVAAAFAGEPLLAHWTQTFMGSAANFFAQFFPLFLLGALFGKLMEDTGSVSAIARFTIERLGAGRAVLAVVLAGALVTYRGVRLFVAFFVLAPMAQELFRSARIPRRLKIR